MWRPCAWAWLTCIVLACSGCSVFSYKPTWEIVKATGTATSYMIAGVPPKAIDTVQHGMGRPETVCIAFNPDVQSIEMLPAIQAALQHRGIESRVFDGVARMPWCPVWLHYAAVVEWGKPPMGSAFQAYVSKAWLTFKTEDGRVLASSAVATGGVWDIGKWASTQDKVEAVVSALLDVANRPSGV